MPDTPARDLLTPHLPAADLLAAAVAIGVCRADDMPGMTAIYRHAVLHGSAGFELEPTAAEEMAQRHAPIRACGRPWLVARLDGRVPGLAPPGCLIVARKGDAGGRRPA